MKLDQNLTKKMDPLLQDVLMEAEGTESITVLMALGAETGQAVGYSEPSFTPSEFADRTEYRRALIAFRQQETQNLLGQTLKQLDQIALKVQTNQLSRVVIAEGSARQVFEALQLPGVMHATIDQPAGWIGTVPDEAVNHVASMVLEIFASAHGQGQGLISQPLDDRTRALISKGAYNYVQGYNQHHARVRIFGKREEVDLESLYTPVQCQDHRQPEGDGSIQSLEKAFGKRNDYWRDRKVKRDGIEVANECSKLIVLGSPGAGKTTFLRKMGLEALKGNQNTFRHRCLPIMIELKKLNSADLKLEALIVEEFRTSAFPSVKDWLPLALDQGKFLILLDGLDEVPTDNQDQVITQIATFVNDHPQNRFIISCRTAAYHRYFSESEIKFETVVVADFDDDQIKQYINHWFREEPDQATQLWNEINQSKALKDLARTPMLLMFLCLVFDKAQSLPRNRSTLYQRALRILLEEWNGLKRLIRDEIFQSLTVDLEETLLAEIAYDRFAQERLFFPKDQLLADINRYIQSNRNAPKHLTGEVILNAVEVQQGILVERARHVYSFSHLTLQEYLTARSIVSNHQISQLVSEHLTEDRWREVFLLVAGLMEGGADPLLLAMEARIQTLQTRKIDQLLDWADRSTQNSLGSYRPAAKRIGVTSIALDYDLDYNLGPNRERSLARDRAFDIARDLDHNLIRALFSEHSFTCKQILNPSLQQKIKSPEALKDQIPDHNQHYKIRRAFTDRIQQILLESLDLTEDLIRFTDEERNDLERYLSANKLLIDCRDAAIRVSEEVWQGIESRMFLPQS